MHLRHARVLLHSSLPKDKICLFHSNHSHLCIPHRNPARRNAPRQIHGNPRHHRRYHRRTPRILHLQNPHQTIFLTTPINFPPQILNYQLPITHHPLPITYIFGSYFQLSLLAFLLHFLSLPSKKSSNMPFNLG